MISVVIPLYNKEKTVARALRSVLDQTYQDFEIIVIDDGSTDQGPAEVAKIHDTRIRLIEQRNGGVSAARNRGVAEARAEWVAFLDADDEWLPHFLETTLRLRNDFPGFGLYATAYDCVAHSGVSRPVTIRGLSDSFFRGVFKDYFRVAATSEPPVHSSAVMINKQNLANIGGFPVGVRSGEDLLTWARISMQFGLVYENQVCTRFYFEPPPEGRLPRLALRFGLVEQGFDELLSQNPPELAEGLRRYVAQWHTMRASSLLRNGFPKKARPFVRRAAALNGFTLKLGFFYALSLVPPRTSKSAFTFLKALIRKQTP